MSIIDIMGLLAVLIGVFLVGYGLRSSQTFTDKVVGGLTGRYTRQTMWYLMGGVLLVLLGGVLLLMLSSGPVVHP